MNHTIEQLRSGALFGKAPFICAYLGHDMNAEVKTMKRVKSSGKCMEQWLQNISLTLSGENRPY